jgi:hypothetical protein
MARENEEELRRTEEAGALGVVTVALGVEATLADTDGLAGSDEARTVVALIGCEGRGFNKPSKVER